MKKNPLHPRRAFTLVELLIVLGIIAGVVAAGIPLFGVLTGARSVEAGRNLVSAALGQARTVAVNEGKYAGVMFYVDPATERTGMAIVIVTDPASSLEDPDPYDKYKTWIDNQDYYSGKLDGLGQTTPHRGDRVIGFAADADTTYRGLLYNPQPASPLTSYYLGLFGNYKPTVRSYRCLTSHKSNDVTGNRPPQNGPYSNNTANEAKLYVRPVAQPATASPGTNYPRPMETVALRGPFTNDNWGLEDQTAVTRYSSGQQTLLPRGVGAQVMIQPIALGGGNSERYLRTAVIMFDPQGRLTLRDFSLEQVDTLGQYLQLATGSVARHIVSGTGVAIYDTTVFKTQADFSESDAVYQPAGTNAYSINAPTNPSMTDFKSNASESTLEETWLDANATPLIVNRYTGSLSEAQ